jgi:hypothetical protein
MTIKIGDVVAIRGDRRMSYMGNGKYVCAYFDNQLVDGKYVMHTGHGGIWTGVVTKINDGSALVGGGWRPLDHLEVIGS